MLARHLAVLNQKLVDLAAGVITRLAVTMPPRHGKSSLTSETFPAWYLGTFPDQRVILASYEAEFAAEWGLKAKNAFDRFMGPLTGLSTVKNRGGGFRWDIAGRQGSMRTAGVRGPITGKGADLLIVDDPVKNQEEANSPSYRLKAWDWWRSTAYTRLEPGGKAMIIQTRWHEEDLLGLILKESVEETGENWDVVNFPAVSESQDIIGRLPGDPLWPERYPLARLEKIRAVVGPYWWSALYQQRPAPLEGGLFKQNWFRYHVPGDGTNPSGIRFLTVDLATSLKTSADFTVIACWTLLPVHPWRLMLVDVRRGRFEGPDIVPEIKSMMHKHNCRFAAIESTGMQLSTLQYAQRAGLPVRELNPTKQEWLPKDKYTRALAASPFFESGRVTFERGAHWLTELESELLTFPSTAHDDQVDAVSYGCLLAEEMARSGAAPVRSSSTQVSPDGPPRELVENQRRAGGRGVYSRARNGLDGLIPK